MLNVSSYTLTDPGAPRNLKPTPMAKLTDYKLVTKRDDGRELLKYQLIELDADLEVIKHPVDWIDDPKLIELWIELRSK